MAGYKVCFTEIVSPINIFFWCHQGVLEHLNKEDAASVAFLVHGNVPLVCSNKTHAHTHTNIKMIIRMCRSGPDSHTHTQASKWPALRARTHAFARARDCRAPLHWCAHRRSPRCRHKAVTSAKWAWRICAVARSATLAPWAAAWTRPSVVWPRAVPPSSLILTRCVRTMCFCHLGILLLIFHFIILLLSAKGHWCRPTACAWCAFATWVVIIMLFFLFFYYQPRGIDFALLRAHDVHLPLGCSYIIITIIIVICYLLFTSFISFIWFIVKKISLCWLLLSHTVCRSWLRTAWWRQTSMPAPLAQATTWGN